MCHAQGVIGETYNRMLVGEAVHDPNSKYFLPDDYTFHGKGTEEDYVVDGLFGETANTMFGKVNPTPTLVHHGLWLAGSALPHVLQPDGILAHPLPWTQVF